MAHAKLNCAAYAFIITSDNEILLQKRSQDAVYMPGKRGVPAGHLEGKESIKQAMVRELSEELGINVNQDNLEIVTNLHYYYPPQQTEYIAYFLLVKDYEGEIQNKEPEKCEELKFFAFGGLPDSDEMVPEVDKAIDNYLLDIKFDEMNL